MTQTDSTTYYTVLNAIDSAGANYSKYAAAPEGGYMRVGNAYYSPLDYGMAGTGDRIARLHPRRHLGCHELPLRRQVKQVIRELEKELAIIEGYRAQLKVRIDDHDERVRKGRPLMPNGAIDRLDRSARVAWAFAEDLKDSIRTLTDQVVPNCPTRRA